MQESPRIAVAGHLVADEIIYASGEKISAPVSVMEKGRIIPVCEIGYDMEEPFGNYFSGHDIIDSSKIKKTSLPNVVNNGAAVTGGYRQ
jgi:hypothetical protein